MLGITIADKNLPNFCTLFFKIKSIMYMLEPNPGPGLGVLLAYMFFCKDKATKDSAPGAVIIHLLGGIHEIYFPYILMNPLVIIAPIAGNIAAIFWFNMMRGKQLILHKGVNSGGHHRKDSAHSRADHRDSAYHPPPVPPCHPSSGGGNQNESAGDYRSHRGKHRCHLLV